MTILILMEKGKIEDIIYKDDETGQMNEYVGCVEIHNYDEGESLDGFQVAEDPDGTRYFKQVFCT